MVGSSAFFCFIQFMHHYSWRPYLNFFPKPSSLAPTAATDALLLFKQPLEPRGSLGLFFAAVVFVPPWGKVIALTEREFIHVTLLPCAIYAFASAASTVSSFATTAAAIICCCLIDLLKLHLEVL